MEITPVLPLNNTPLDFDCMDCLVQGAQATIVDDGELNIENPIPVIELIGQESKIKFFVDCDRPKIAFHFKTLKRFFTIVLVCLDDNGQEKIFQLSNKSSFVTVDSNICKLPFSCQDGWQYSSIDLEELMANAFGVSYRKCIEVVVCGTCRLSKIYFQSQEYSDIELPSFLRVLN